MQPALLTTLPQFGKYDFDKVIPLCMHVEEGGGDEYVDCFPLLCYIGILYLR